MQSNGLYAAYDRKAQYYLPLFQVRSDADAVRSFTEAIVSSDTSLSKYPADYDLVRVGVINLESGRIDPEFPVGLLINGLVALENAHLERRRYVAAVKGEQKDIEDFIAENS